MRWTACLAAAGLVATAAATTAQAPRLALLESLTPGSWTLHEIATDGAARSICIGDPAALLQIHHGAAPCPHFVVSASGRNVTVEYTCPRNGHGRTTLSVEGPTLARIHTQGIANGAPFDVDYEARRSGPCARSAKN